MKEPSDHRSSATIRSVGWLKALGGLVAIVLLWPIGYMDLLERLMKHPQGSPHWLAGALLAGLVSAPFVLFCVGLVEAATGRPFRQLSSKWNQMKEWKQGILSFLLIWLGLGFIALLLYRTVRYFSA